MNYQQKFERSVLNQMKQKGVVIYGAGKRGNALFDILTDKGFEVKCVIDKDAGKKCGSLTSIRLEYIERDVTACALFPQIYPKKNCQR